MNKLFLCFAGLHLACGHTLGKVIRRYEYSDNTYLTQCACCSSNAQYQLIIPTNNTRFLDVDIKTEQFIIGLNESIST